MQRPGPGLPRPGLSRFNPHPARRPDATSVGRQSGSGLTMFQSSSGQKAGCNKLDAFDPTAGNTFQSSSGQKAGCNDAHHAGGADLVLVSILNPARRPDATPGPGLPRPGLSRFNPHPARRPDATRERLVRRQRPVTRFNPHPARRPDATSTILCGLHHDPGSRVSILIRPEGRMQQQVRAQLHTPELPDVSILIRPEGRMQPVAIFVGWGDQTSPRFNPHPARRPDATPVSEIPICSARTS